MPIQQDENRRSVVPLIEGEHDDVQVIRLDGDRFVTTAQQAINFLSLAGHAVEFQAQLKELLDRLYGWVEQQKAQVSAAYIVLAADGITLVVLQRVVEFDFELEEKLTDLDLEVASSDDFTLIPFSTLLVPKVGPTVLKSFLSSGQIMQHTFNAEPK